MIQRLSKYQMIHVSFYIISPFENKILLVLDFEWYKSYGFVM